MAINNLGWQFHGVLRPFPWRHDLMAIYTFPHTRLHVEIKVNLNRDTQNPIESPIYDQTFKRNTLLREHGNSVESR